MALERLDHQHLPGQDVDRAGLGDGPGQGHDPDNLLDGHVAEPGGQQGAGFCIAADNHGKQAHDSRPEGLAGEDSDNQHAKEDAQHADALGGDAGEGLNQLPEKEHQEKANGGAYVIRGFALCCRHSISSLSQSLPDWGGIPPSCLNIAHQLCVCKAVKLDIPCYFCFGSLYKSGGAKWPRRSCLSIRFCCWRTSSRSTSGTRRRRSCPSRPDAADTTRWCWPCRSGRCTSDSSRAWW